MPAAGARPIVQFRTVSLNYFSSLAIRLRAGRFFTEDDLKQLNAVINETMARRFWPQAMPWGSGSISVRRSQTVLVHDYRYREMCTVWAGC